PAGEPVLGVEGERQDGWLLAVSGDVDLTARPVVAAALAEVRGRPVVVDLTDVQYLASAGIALLGEAAAGSALSLVVAAGSAPARALEITGLADAVPTTVVSPAAEAPA
ncbi:STAS domain-containing protein, partial [Pseudonocardia pini]|uniref:STAS domain-containing protein n=1 Tax=Pseudonocardia pini TaxID=2758030 RepID=UPI0015F07AA6